MLTTFLLCRLIHVKKPADGSGTQKVNNGHVANAPVVMVHPALATTARAAHVVVVNVLQQLLALVHVPAAVGMQHNRQDILAPAQPEAADTVAITKMITHKNSGVDLSPLFLFDNMALCHLEECVARRKDLRT